MSGAVETFECRVMCWGGILEHYHDEGGGPWFTYTRTYAILLPDKKIERLLAVKRNGSVVYSIDPEVPVFCKDAADEWEKRATIYIGGDVDCPAFILMDREDVTSTNGCIPDYEVVVEFA